MKKKNNKEDINRISQGDFIDADSFNAYNVPMPDSMRKKKRKKGRDNAPSVQPEGTRMPEMREAEHRREVQRQHLEEMEYVRRAELAREAEAERHRQMQKMLRERELERAAQGLQQTEDEDTYEQAGRITVTSVSPQDNEDNENEEIFQDYDDDEPSFKYLSFKDGKISDEDGFSEDMQDPGDEDSTEREISQQITAESATVTDIRQKRKKAKSRKLVKRLVALGIIAAVGVAAFVTSKYWIPKLEGLFDKPHDTIVNDGKAEGGNFPLKISQSGITSLTQCAGMMVTLDGSRVVFYDPDGSQYNTIAHNYGSPVIDVSEKKILAYDNSGRSFQVMTKKNTVYTKKTDNPILLAKIGPGGYAAVVTQTEKNSAFVTVYDETGAEIYTWASGRRVVDICFDEDGKGCCISTIVSSGGKLDSMIYAVRFDSSDPVMTSTIPDSLVLRTQKMKNGEYWAICDDKFVALDENGAQKRTTAFGNELVSLAVDPGCAAVYTGSVTGSHGELLIFDADKDSEGASSRIDISGKPRKLQLDEKTVIVFNDKTVESYDISGAKLATANVSQSYVDFVYVDKAVYLMGYRDINKIKFDT